MRIISTKVHGLMDYLMGFLLIASPWVFGFANGGSETTIPVVLGVVLLVMSLMTNYELGVIKRIRMPIHLYMDIIAGLFLAVSPWLFGFHDQVYIPHLIFGILEIGAGLMTSEVPAYKENVYATPAGGSASVRRS